jgi:hypothetical protein
MVRFTGRVKEIVTIPIKPTPTGFKIWALAQQGFFLSWCFHAYSKGPISTAKPLKLPEKGQKPLTDCQTVVISLTQLLPKQQQPYHLWLDNLFTNIKLLKYLCIKDIAATGITHTNSGIYKSLVELKAKDKKQDHLFWGYFEEIPDPSGQINQFAWKDQSLILSLNTAVTTPAIVKSIRKKPRAVDKKQARAPFGNSATKKLEIPEYYNQYNHNMNSVDIADHLRVGNKGLRRIKRPGSAWWALWQWLFNMVLVNSFKLSSGFKSQFEFRDSLIDGLLQTGSKWREQRPVRNRPTEAPSIQPKTMARSQHCLQKRGINQECSQCKDTGNGPVPRKRRALCEISSNTHSWKKVKRSTFGCLACNVSLCKEGLCFDRFHEKI